MPESLDSASAGQTVAGEGRKEYRADRRVRTNNSYNLGYPMLLGGRREEGFTYGASDDVASPLCLSSLDQTFVHQGQQDVLEEVLGNRLLPGQLGDQGKARAVRPRE
jgi:hypothetical protein